MSNIFSTKNNKKIPDAEFLDSAQIGVPYKITACSMQGILRGRLAELGLTVGARVIVLKKAPLGDPLEISLRGYSLCIRANEAKLFTITRLNDE